MSKPIEHRGFRIVRYERPSKNRRFGNLKFWTTEPPLHETPSDPLDRFLGTRSIIYVQTRQEMQTIIDLHLDGARSEGYPRECPGCSTR